MPTAATQELQPHLHDVHGGPQPQLFQAAQEAALHASQRPVSASHDIFSF
jgi:hypothetical protein